MKLQGLKLGLGVDLQAFGTDLTKAFALVQDLGKKAVIAPRAEAGGGEGKSAAGGLDAGALGAQIRAASKSAVPSLSLDLGKEFDRVGGTIITAFRRIDAAMKFPQFDAALTSVSGRLFGVAGSSARAFAAIAAGAVTATVRASKLSGTLGVLVAAAGTVATVVSARFLGITAAIGLVAGSVVKLGQTVYRAANFFSSLGDVAGKSFSKLFKGVTYLSGLARGTNAYKAAASGANSLTKNWAGSMGRLGAEILAAFGVVGVIYKAVTFLRDGVKAASDLNETVSAGQQVFGGSFKQIEAQANKNATAFGLGTKAQLEAANSFGALAQGAGYGEAASAKFANQFTQLAADVGSFKNIPLTDAAHDLRSALSGESEPLKKYGILLDESKVKAEAAAMGLTTYSRKGKTVTTVLSDQASMAARASLITKGLAAASGDLARTQDSAANQFRKAGGGVALFGEKIGAILLPAVKLGTSAFNSLLESVLTLFDDNLATIQGWVGYLSAGMEQVAKVARNFGAYFQIAQLRVGAFAAYVIDFLGLLPQNWTKVTDYLATNWWNLILDLTQVFERFGVNLITNAKALGIAIWDALSGKEFKFEFTPLLDGFTRISEKFPELMLPAAQDVGKQIDEILEGVAKKEAIRAAEIAKAAGGAAKPKGLEAAKAATQTPDRKLAEAVEINSKEAYSAIARNAAGNRDSKSDQIARNTRETARESKRAADAILRQQPGGAANPFGVAVFNI